MSRISAIFLPASRLLLASPERAGPSRRAGHGAVGRFWLAIGGTRTSRRCPLMRSTHRCWAWREGQQGRARRVPSKIDEMAGIVWLREQLDLSRAAVAGRA